LRSTAPTSETSRRSRQSGHRWSMIGAPAQRLPPRSSGTLRAHGSAHVGRFRGLALTVDPRAVTDRNRIVDRRRRRRVPRRSRTHHPLSTPMARRMDPRITVSRKETETRHRRVGETPPAYSLSDGGSSRSRETPAASSARRRALRQRLRDRAILGAQDFSRHCGAKFERRSRSRASYIGPDLHFCVGDEGLDPPSSAV
jgi:hypothetical protein